MAAALDGHGLHDLSRIAEPNIVGAIGKSAALIFGSSPQSKALWFAGAQAIEAETNMTSRERAVTMVAGAGAAAMALAFRKDKLGLSIAMVDAGLAVTSTFAEHVFWDRSK